MRNYLRSPKYLVFIIVSICPVPTVADVPSVSYNAELSGGQLRDQGWIVETDNVPTADAAANPDTCQAWEIQSQDGHYFVSRGLQDSDAISLHNKDWSLRLESKIKSGRSASVHMSDGKNKFQVDLSRDSAGSLAATINRGDLPAIAVSNTTDITFNRVKISYTASTGNATLRVDGLAVATWRGEPASGAEIRWGHRAAPANGNSAFRSVDLYMGHPGEGNLLATYYANMGDGNPDSQGWRIDQAGNALAARKLQDCSVYRIDGVNRMHVVRQTPVQGFGSNRISFEVRVLSGVAHVVYYSNGRRRFVPELSINAAGNLQMRQWGGDGGTYTIAKGADATAYHHYELHYSSKTQRATLFVDGKAIGDSWSGDYQQENHHMQQADVVWGNAATSRDGVSLFRYVAASGTPDIVVLPVAEATEIFAPLHMYMTSSAHGTATNATNVLTYYHTTLTGSRIPPKGLADISTDGGRTWVRNQTVNGSHRGVFISPDRERIAYFTHATGGKLAVISDEQDDWSDKVYDVSFNLGGYGNKMLFLESGHWLVSHRDKGSAFTTSLSLDKGKTWTKSSSSFLSPTYEDKWHNDGTSPQTVVNDSANTLWTLTRNAQEPLFEYFSTNEGRTWSAGNPSRFYGTNTVLEHKRLSDGRLLLLWLNTLTLPTESGDYNYYSNTNRDVVHAAISDDNGATYRGFREILYDVRRHHEDYKGVSSWDYGVQHTRSVESDDGKIFVFSGQTVGHSRAVAFDPDWLMETHAEIDFSDVNFARNIDGLHTYSYLRTKTLRNRIFDRMIGADIVDSPTDPSDKVLRIRRETNPMLVEEREGASWNFPSGYAGEITFKVFLNKGFRGGQISLIDRYYSPTDPMGEKNAMYVLPISADGEISPDTRLTTAQWHTIRLVWDGTTRMGAHKADLYIDERRQKSSLNLRYPAPNGINTVRFRSTSPKEDLSGFLVSSISVAITPLHRPVLVTNQPLLDYRVRKSIGGVDDAVDVSSDLDAIRGLDVGAIYARFRFDTRLMHDDAPGAIFSVSNSATNDEYSMLWTGASGRGQYTQRSPDSGQTDQWLRFFTDDGWHTVLINFEGSSTQAYVDGRMLNTITTTMPFAAIANANNMHIGKLVKNGLDEHVLDGQIDTVRIYDHTIPPNIASRMSRNEAPTPLHDFYLYGSFDGNPDHAVTADLYSRESGQRSGGAFYMRFRSTGSGASTLIVTSGRDVGDGSFAVKLTKDGHLRVEANSAEGRALESGNSNYNDGAWHEIVFVEGDRGIRLFADGELADVDHASAALEPPSEIVIGSELYSPARQGFKGVVDQIKFYDVELSDDHALRLSANPAVAN